MRDTIFDQPQSIELNRKCLDHLAGLKLDDYLRNARVLEVASGVGNLTTAFGQLASEIISTDGRESNVQEHKCRYPDHTVYTVDLLESQSHHHLGRFDIVFCYGVLYHLGKPAEVIADLAAICNGMLLIESMISNEEELNIVVEQWGGGDDQSLDGFACYPSVKWVVSELKKHFAHVYVPHFLADREVFIGSRLALQHLEEV